MLSVNRHGKFPKILDLSLWDGCLVNHFVKLLVKLVSLLLESGIILDHLYFFLKCQVYFVSNSTICLVIKWLYLGYIILVNIRAYGSLLVYFYVCSWRRFIGFLQVLMLFSQMYFQNSQSSQLSGTECAPLSSFQGKHVLLSISQCCGGWRSHLRASSGLAPPSCRPYFTLAFCVEKVCYVLHMNSISNIKFTFWHFLHTHLNY